MMRLILRDDHLPLVAPDFLSAGNVAKTSVGEGLMIGVFVHLFRRTRFCSETLQPSSSDRWHAHSSNTCVNTKYFSRMYGNIEKTH